MLAPDRLPGQTLEAAGRGLGQQAEVRGPLEGLTPRPGNSKHALKIGHNYVFGATIEFCAAFGKKHYFTVFQRRFSNTFIYYVTIGMLRIVELFSDPQWQLT